MILTRTNSTNPDFLALVKLLDAGLMITDGDSHAFYDQFNKVEDIKHVIVVYIEDVAVACGSIKEYDSETMEIKRMYTLPSERGKGIAKAILSELEKWAEELSYKKCMLETGINQVEAIALYNKSGYQRITNYGQYIGVVKSFCYEKTLP